MYLKFLNNNKIKRNALGISLLSDWILAFASMTFLRLSSLGEYSSSLSSLGEYSSSLSSLGEYSSSLSSLGERSETRGSIKQKYRINNYLQI